MNNNDAPTCAPDDPDFRPGFMNPLVIVQDIFNKDMNAYWEVQESGWICKDEKLGDPDFRPAFCLSDEELAEAWDLSQKEPCEAAN